MPRITKRLVESAEVREKDYIICDDELRGASCPAGSATTSSSTGSAPAIAA